MPRSSFKTTKTLNYAKETIVKILLILQCRKIPRGIPLRLKKPFSPTENTKTLFLSINFFSRIYFFGKNFQF